MQGPNIDDPEMKGIIPRITEQVFASIMTSPANLEYLVKVSYMEIYMERIRDLLSRKSLLISQARPRHTLIAFLSQLRTTTCRCTRTSSAEFTSRTCLNSTSATRPKFTRSCAREARRGPFHPRVRQPPLLVSTQPRSNSPLLHGADMNAESSRSHSIFVMTIQARNTETGTQKTGSLFLVDLAGSEKISKTGATGQTLEEAKKINKSLSALGMVINALTDGKVRTSSRKDADQCASSD